MMEDAVRLRVVFEDRHMLSKSQKLGGLKRSWFLLQPQHYDTISDFASHLLHVFDLHDSCPNGLLLSMDGFIFPPFESTCILKDKDVVCVKRKRGTLSDISKTAHGSSSFEEDEIVEKQPVLADRKLLANEEFEKQSGGYQSEPDEDECEGPGQTSPLENALVGNRNSKKRKAPKKLESSKRKKICHVLPEDAGKDLHIEPIGHQDEVLPKKSPRKTRKSSIVKGKTDAVSIPEIARNSIECMPSLKMSGEIQENAIQCVDVSNVTDGIKKVPSRSARRKKAKRKWLRERAIVEKKDVCQGNEDPRIPMEHQHQDQNNEMENDVVEYQHQDQNSDVEDDVVPVVIRPGHIRFEPLGKEQVAQQNQVPAETFCWNGITSKKKGQKWGREKFSSCGRNGYADFGQEHPDVLAYEEETPIRDPSIVDFDKLPPLVSMPKEGDILAYRLIELSSSWTPELSSFRVGEVSSYDTDCNKIILLPVPEYPIVSENLDEDGSALPPDTSLYREDGTLEIDFRSLVDIRIVNSHPVKAVAGKVNGAPAGNQEAASGAAPSVENKETHTPSTGTYISSSFRVADKVNGAPVGNQEATSDVTPKVDNKETCTPSTENGEASTWDEISEALREKKAQLSQGDGHKESSGRRPGSYRALRSSALGPTMALLRAKNDL